MISPDAHEELMNTDINYVKRHYENKLECLEAALGYAAEIMFFCDALSWSLYDKGRKVTNIHQYKASLLSDVLEHDYCGTDHVIKEQYKPFAKMKVI